MIIQFSAGGIVYKTTNHGIEILVGQHSGHHGWVFPKGLIGDHNEAEKKEETAVREVQEETGIIGKILHPLTPYTFVFEWKGEKHQKSVTFFVMEYVSGDTKDHDWEMEQVVWLPLDQVEERITYPLEKNVWKEAREYIEKTVKR